MNITEIFFSLQGESTFSGLPCIFIRLAECNLRCTYCDTPHSLHTGTAYSLKQILELTESNPCRLAEVTGGEPMLQPEAIDLMQLLLDKGYTVLLETNGSLPLKAVPASVHIITDVKLPGSGQAESFLEENLSCLQPGKDEIKFVCTDKADFDYAVAFIRKHDLIRHTLLFSAVTDRLEPALLADWILHSGLPLRLNLQLHKLLNIS